VDGAIIQAATARGWHDGELNRVEFKPFDPATKRAEAVYRGSTGPEQFCFLKGAPAVIANLAGTPESLWQTPAAAIIAKGQRVLAVAQGDGDSAKLVGLLGLEDAVREDSKAVVGAIRDAGVRVVMVTGDNELTARSVAEQVGIPPVVCPPEKLRGDLCGDVVDCSVFAGVFPEDKFKLVRAFQRRGAVVGMSGDGVNDAPALRQAEAGVALAAGRLVFSLGVFLWGHYQLGLDMRHLQSLTFFTTILSTQAGVYLLRERRHFWQSPPSRFLVWSSVLGVGAATILSGGGLLMPAIGAPVLLGVAGFGLVYFTGLDWPKVWLFRRLNLR
jgi:magnesium-transporting ATPase (P-type)